jgi:hypothetical protein
MKKVDRSHEHERSRRSSLRPIGLVIAILLGLSLVSYGHDYSILPLSVLGIIVLIAGGILPFTVGMLHQKSAIRDPNPWKGRILSLLTFAVATCVFLTIGLLLYGFEYGDFGIVRSAVLVMWIGVGFFVAYTIIPHSRMTRESYREAVRLSISNLMDAEGYGLKWPNGKGGLWFGIYSLNIAQELDAEFLLANTPSDCRIFLAVSAWADDREHIELKDRLNQAGDPYKEEFEKHGGNRWQTILAATRDEAIVKQIFEGYPFYYGTYLSYPFIIAKGELNLWIDSLRELSKNGMGALTRDLIERSHCVMFTDWDHGLEMLTDKISEENVVEIAKRIASAHSLLFVNMGDVVTD